MPKTIIEAERTLPYAPQDLCRLVGDARSYPDFIPYLKSVKITREKQKPEGGWEGVAEAVVGWKAITERFTTQIKCDLAKGEVVVTLVKGPLHALDNRWRFSPAPDGGTKVKFWISYHFKNPVLHQVVTANRDKIIGRILEAFEAEARRRLASPASA